MMFRLASLLLASTVLTAPAIAKDTSFRGSVQAVPVSGPTDKARGKVFVDSNRNTQLYDGEIGLVGVQVSNGREVVLTAAAGSYELQAYEDMNLFITKPAGYAVPVNEEMVPQFAYIHNVAGSPPLRYGGIDPTGPLPKAVNFPPIEDKVGDGFHCLAFGDTQPYKNRKIFFVRDTLGEMLANRDNSKTECLIFEGDVMGEDLSLYPRFKKIVATAGVPQYYVGGNHDLDLDAKERCAFFRYFPSRVGTGILLLRHRQSAFCGARQCALPLQRRRSAPVLRSFGETVLQRCHPAAPDRLAEKRPG